MGENTNEGVKNANNGWEIVVEYLSSGLLRQMPRLSSRPAFSAGRLLLRIVLNSGDAGMMEYIILHERNLKPVFGIGTSASLNNHLVETCPHGIEGNINIISS